VCTHIAGVCDGGSEGESILGHQPVYSQQQQAAGVQQQVEVAPICGTRGTLHTDLGHSKRGRRFADISGMKLVRQVKYTTGRKSRTYITYMTFNIIYTQ
jgi:hypothetical protein